MSDERIDNYYTATLNDRRQYAPLDGDEQADIAIIGGGLTGVATALELAERGKSVILLESNRRLGCIRTKRWSGYRQSLW